MERSEIKSIVESFAKQLYQKGILTSPITQKEQLSNISKIDLIEDSITDALEILLTSKVELAVEKALPKWIDVNDRLPDHFNKVLCIFEATNYTSYSIGCKYKRNNGTFCMVDAEEESSITITHWQPLPSPPSNEIIEQLNKGE